MLLPLPLLLLLIVLLLKSTLCTGLLSCSMQCSSCKDHMCMAADLQKPAVVLGWCSNLACFLSMPWQLLRVWKFQTSISTLFVALKATMYLLLSTVNLPSDLVLHSSRKSCWHRFSAGWCVYMARACTWFVLQWVSNNECGPHHVV